MSKFVCDSGVLLFAGSDFADGSWDVNSVTIDVTADTVNYPTMGNDGWDDKLTATKSCEFSWETSLDSVDGIDLDNTIGVEAELIFNTNNGPQYTATVVITGTSINTPTDDVATVSWTATCNGEITEDISS